MKAMALVHMSETEVAKNFASVLEKVRQGAEIVVDQDHCPVAVIKTPQRPGRSLCCTSEGLRNRLGFASIPDAGFAQDVQAAIDTHREQLNPPSWD